jgi:hypothetical protein
VTRYIEGKEKPTAEAFQRRETTKRKENKESKENY